jgi:recombination protein RecA
MRKKNDEVVGNYFLKEKPLQFVSSGCEVLNCVLGGGYPLGRISNIIGNESTNKTGLSVEAIANFRKDYPDGFIWYQDAEAAFDIDYAITLGLPTDEKTFVIDDTRSIDKTYELMKSAVKTVKEENSTGIYVIDTLDALLPIKDGDELAEGYDAAKRAALLNSLITSIAGQVRDANIHLMIVSQTRENVGVMMGAKYRVGGGKALGFYASQRLWLSEKSKITKTVKGIKRAYGIEILAKCKKNKIGFPFRECEFPVIFNYGIDDLSANLDFLKSVKGSLEELGFTNTDVKQIKQEIYDNSDTELIKKIEAHVRKVWAEVESGFIVDKQKYVYSNLTDEKETD